VSHADAVRNRLDDLGTTTDVVLVTFTDPTNLVGYQTKHQFPFPVLTDPTRAVYQAYGFPRGSVWRVYGWKVVRKYLEIFRESGFRRLDRATEDTLQLGGDVVIDAQGNLAWGFWGDGPDDRPSVDDLVAAVRSAS
jgi:hypothetical protein